MRDEEKDWRTRTYSKSVGEAKKGREKNQRKSEERNITNSKID